MNDQLYKCNKLFALYTQEEKDQIDSILAEFLLASKKVEKELQQGKRKFKNPEEATSFWTLLNTPYSQKIEAITNAVRARYILAFNGDATAILEDVREILNVIDKKDFMQEIKIRKMLIFSEDTLLHSFESIQDPIKREEAINNIPAIIKSRKQAAIANYWNCYDFLLSQLTDQIEALQQYGLPLSGLEELTAARASEWYTKVDTQQILPHTKQLRKLEKFLYLDDDITTRIFNGERNIKTHNGTIVMVDFDELEGVKISKELTLYEEFVWQTCVNLIVQDNHEILTVEQIYKAMGNPGRPTPSIKEEILEAVKIASRTRVSIDTAAEISKYPNTDRISAEFQLLDTEIVTAYSRGKIVKNGIKILGVPKLYTFAANRKQVSCLPASILEVPVSKTKQTIPLLNYLVQRILKIKNDKDAPKEILLDTLFLHCRIDSKSKRSRLLNEKNGTLRAILDHFISNGFIKEYHISSRDIEITI